MRWKFKGLILTLVLALLLCVVPKANAEVVVLDPGETVSFTIEYESACALEGRISFSNPSIISNVQYDISGCKMDGLAENGLIFLYTGKPEGVSGKVVITVTILSTAPTGSSSIVTLEYNLTQPGSNVPGETQTVVSTVAVITDEGLQPTEPPATQPTSPSVKYADTTELKKQIAIADSLTSYQYTRETWAALEKAVSKGRSLLTSTSQSQVDSTTKEIKAKLQALAPMDYTKLQAALDGAENLGDLSELAEYWKRFVQALTDARIQRTSGDQAAVDAATQELIDSKEALLQALKEMEQVIVVDKEVPVEVPPSYDFCNIPVHTVHKIIMIASLVLNGLLIALICVYLHKKHMLEKDTTPLVNYEIDDDLEDMMEDEME